MHLKNVKYDAIWKEKLKKYESIEIIFMFILSMNMHL